MRFSTRTVSISAELLSYPRRLLPHLPLPLSKRPMMVLVCHASSRPPLFLLPLFVGHYLTQVTAPSFGYSIYDVQTKGDGVDVMKKETEQETEKEKEEGIEQKRTSVLLGAANSTVTLENDLLSVQISRSAVPLFSFIPSFFRFFSSSFFSSFSFFSYAISFSSSSASFMSLFPHLLYHSP